MASPTPDRSAALNLPSPKPLDPPDVPGDVKALADAIDTAVQGGTVGVPVSGLTWASIPVTFPKAFGGTPAVTATPFADATIGGPQVCAVYNITPTGFTLAAGSRDVAVITRTITCQWIAIGPAHS